MIDRQGRFAYARKRIVVALEEEGIANIVIWGIGREPFSIAKDSEWGWGVRRCSSHGEPLVVA